MLIRNTFIFSILTFVSRIFGFIRDSILAAVFGTSIYADAFNIAFKLPNLFRSIFAEGAFSSAFVPIFSSKLHSDGKDQALAFAGKIYSWLILASALFVCILIIFMPHIVGIIAPGFEQTPSKKELAIDLSIITAPYLFLITILTFYGCILNSINNFKLIAGAPIILNIIMIIFALMFGNNQLEKAYYISVSILVGGVFQLLWGYITLRAKGYLPKLRSVKSEEKTEKFFSKIIPAALGSGISQINLWIGTILATHIPSAVSLIYFADRVVQLPLALIGVSTGVVILPSLSKFFREKNIKLANFTQNRAIELSMLFAFPCVIGIIVLAKPIIEILFERGNFTNDDTIKTIPALVTLGLAIPAYVTNKVFSSSFFASGDTKSPMYISTICVILNLFLSIALMRKYSYVGITMSTSIVAYINVLLMGIVLNKNNKLSLDFEFFHKMLKMVVANFIFYLLLKSSYQIIQNYLISHAYQKANLIGLIIILLLSLVFYCFSIIATKTYDIKTIKSFFANKNG